MRAFYLYTFSRFSTSAAQRRWATSVNASQKCPGAHPAGNRNKFIPVGRKRLSSRGLITTWRLALSQDFHRLRSSAKKNCVAQPSFHLKWASRRPQTTLFLSALPSCYSPGRCCSWSLSGSHRHTGQLCSRAWSSVQPHTLGIWAFQRLQRPHGGRQSRSNRSHSPSGSNSAGRSFCRDRPTIGRLVNEELEKQNIFYLFKGSFTQTTSEISSEGVLCPIGQN